MNKPFLAICIPTYNRAEHLSQRLQELIPQLSESNVLHIYDNASADNTKEVVQQYSSPHVFYHRAENNLGMSANICKCFTETQSHWMWMIGDDDRVRGDAIRRCLTLVENTQADVINTVTLACANPVEAVVQSIEELLSYKNPTDLMHASSNLYRLEALRQSFKILAPAGITMAPHLVLILHAFVHSKISLELSRVELLNQEINRRRYSSMELAIGMAEIPIYLPHYLRRKIAKSLRFSTRWMLLWGLVEIENLQDALQWKINARLVDGVLALHGASFGSTLQTILTSKESKRDLMIQILKQLPKSFVIYLAEIQRRKHQDRLNIISHELH